MNGIALWDIKNYGWAWIAADRLGQRFLHAGTGTRGVATGEQLWEGIKIPLIIQVMTDSWEPSEHVVPPEKPIQSKAETFTVEGDHSVCRHFLARFRRKPKCDSKSEFMLRYSIRLMMAKWNGEPGYILN